jgi:hypothetical protein
MRASDSVMLNNLKTDKELIAETLDCSIGEIPYGVNPKNGGG